MSHFTRKLILEDGSVYPGFAFGSPTDRVCEVVFNTSMTGYQEIISDPSYTDQMIVMTYPMIGNYGITDEDFESGAIHAGGLIVRDYNNSPSNFRYTQTLSELLTEHDVPGICGIDTRALTRRIRDKGACRALLTSYDTSVEDGLAAIAAAPSPRDAVSRVTSRKIRYSRTANPRFNVVAVDCGIKTNIIRCLNAVGCNVTVVPYDITAEQVLALNPDGVFLSNGPGNPEDAGPVIELVRRIRGRLPLFGICLGHQIIALALGGRTYKLKFGHHGGNHPVKNRLTGRIEMTSQNHNYAVDEASLAQTPLKVTHLNLLDNTVEGASCPEEHIFSVQYHPESAPGPQDSRYLFDQFTAMMQEVKDHA